MQLTVQAGIQKIVDGAQNILRSGKEGQAIVGEMHGQYYEAASRGQVFIGGTVIAGVVIPVAAATLNSKFTLWNPAGSGVNVELISCTVGIDSATDVVNTVGLMIQRNLTGTSGIPTSLTAALPLALGLGGQSACSLAVQATLTNVAIPGVTAATTVPIAWYPMWSYGAVTATAFGDTTHMFNGKVVLGPDSLVAACTNVAASTASSISIIWAEYPV
jgi:hypothetical protein